MDREKLKEGWCTICGGEQLGYPVTKIAETDRYGDFSRWLRLHVCKDCMIQHQINKREKLEDCIPKLVLALIVGLPCSILGVWATFSSLLDGDFVDLAFALPWVLFGVSVFLWGSEDFLKRYVKPRPSSYLAKVLAWENIKKKPPNYLLDYALYGDGENDLLERFCPRKNLGSKDLRVRDEARAAAKAAMAKLSQNSFDDLMYYVRVFSKVGEDDMSVLYKGPPEKYILYKGADAYCKVLRKYDIEFKVHSRID